MNKDRLIGILMIGLIIIIIMMYFFNSTNEKKIENENEELKSMLEKSREDNEDRKQTSTDETNNNIEDDTSEESESQSQKNKDTEINVDDAGELINNELGNYDEFIEEFITTLNIYDDQETKNELLYSMTNEKVQTYLKENYYILENSEQLEDAHNHGDHTEGDFEPLEMDMDLSSIKSYYTYTNNNIEVVTLYKMNTTAGDEKFSGNYVLKGSLTNENGEIKFNRIDSIVAINDPNAEELYSNTSEE